jgi:hypothetical protein
MTRWTVRIALLCVVMLGAVVTQGSLAPRAPARTQAQSHNPPE